MTSTPREIGTLVVVILRARHLPNKRHIGKQDPYCCVSMNGEKRRTKALKRGGQHPEWDEEVRFTLWEDVEDELQRTAQGDGTPPAPPPKSDKEKVNLKKIKGGKILKVSCYADDPREPDLIGETTVDLTEVLTKGETDEWFTLTSKDKFCGQVYLEMTFWSNERPPKKKPTKFREDYGGAGSFVPLGDSPSTLQSVDENGVQSSRISSMSSIQDHSRHTSNSIPPSLRASSSLARLDLYVPPYQSGNHGSVLDRITNDFGQLEVVDHRRDSFPPPHDGYIQRPSSSFSSLPPQPSHSYEQALRSDGESMYSYDRPLTPLGQSSLHHRSTLPTPQQTYPPQTPYQHQYDQQPYENGSPAAYPTHQPSVRGPRYSIPSSSSGFVPISNSSSFTQPLQSYPSDSSGFVGPQSSTPAAPPSGYSPSHYAHQSGFAPLPSQTPIPNGYAPPQQSQFTPSQSFTFSQYPPPPSMSTPLQQQQQQQQQYMAPPQPPQSVPPQTYSAPPPQQPFAYSLPPSPPHENIQPAPPPPPPQNSSLSSSTSQGSRPLPPQPQVYAQQQQGQPSYGLPPASYSPNAPGSIIFPTANPYQSIPPPPPPPSASHMQAPPTSSHMQGNSTYAVNGHISNAGLPIPPPPPPAPPGQSQSQFDQGQSTRPRRQSSLPQPPVLQNYQTQQHQQPAVYQPIPPPPPPPLPSSHSHDFSQQPHQLPPPPPLLPAQNQSYYPGPPPQPPAMINHQPHWSPQHNGALPSHGSYIQQGW